MKALRKCTIWILVVLFLLPVLAFGIWYSRRIHQQRLDNELIAAIKKNDIPIAISLLNQGANANATDIPYVPLTMKSLLADVEDRMRGYVPEPDTEYHASALLLPDSPLYVRSNYASPYEDHPELVRALLEHGANPNVVDKSGDTALLKACENHQIKTVKVLLEHHVNPNVPDINGFAPLSYATHECVRLLVEHGANINVQNQEGQTALIRAVVSGNHDGQVEFLLQHHALVSIKDKAGNTALDYAKAYQAEYLMRLLGEEMIKERATQKSSSTPATR